MANGLFGGGNGSFDNPFLVEDAADLNAIRNDKTASYEQTENINLSVFSTWKPIGENVYPEDEKKSFTGNYNGGGYEISDLKHESPKDYEGEIFWAGLFGHIYNAVIENVNLLNAFISAKYCGGVVGIGFHGSKIENCHVFNSFISGEYNTGGIIGSMQDGTVVKNVSVSGDIEGDSYIGGVVGGSTTGETYGDNGSYAGENLLERSFFSGTVKGSDYIGGIIGSTGRSLNLKIAQCDGDITGYDTVGGISGHSDRTTTMEDVRFNGIIRVESANGGGIVGELDRDNILTRAIATGKLIVMYYNTGGIIGNANNRGARATNIYALQEEITVLDNVGEDAGYLAGRIDRRTTVHGYYLSDLQSNVILDGPGNPMQQSAAKKKTTYTGAGFNFTDVWSIDEDSTYPYILKMKSKSRTRCERINITKLLGGY